MQNVIQECQCTVGPYEGYVGRAEYDADARLFHGTVLGTRDVITFAGKELADLATAFQESVDDYLDFCRQRNERPDKPFSGQFVTRIPPDTHRQISTLAQAEGKSLNQFVRDVLENAVSRGGEPLTAVKRRAANPKTRKKRKSVK
ncbi:MAG: type II toxin-antitoxin system HicB family antitoxin [Pirellulales bacterium]